MQKLARLCFAASLGIILLTSGCFRPGGAALESTNAALGAPTFTPPPTDTPPPLEPIVQTVVVTQVAQLPTEEMLDPIAQAETEIAQNAFPTPDPFATTPDPFVLLTGTAVADASFPGGFQQEDLFAGTLTAQALEGGILPDDMGFSEQPFELDPPFQTATAIIIQSTLNVSIEQTQTAAALFGPSPTPPSPFEPTATSFGGESGGIAPTAQPPVVPGQNCVYGVQVGDNLFRIGLRFGVPYQQIAAANGILNPNLIYPGQQLTIPGVGTNCAPLPVTPIPVTPPPGGGGRIHTVMQGETLFQLSMMYRPTTVHQIAAANGIQNINLIYIGQQLVIP